MLCFLPRQPCLETVPSDVTGPVRLHFLRCQHRERRVDHRQYATAALAAVTRGACWNYVFCRVFAAAGDRPHVVHRAGAGDTAIPTAAIEQFEYPEPFGASE